MEAIDCQGFAGGYTLGAVQAGFELVAKREMKGGFGLPNCEANRHLLGHGWDAQAVPPDEWEPRDAWYVFGNPPCSGFSGLSAASFRGIDSPINSCMWSFVDFASRCRPYVAIFESVQQAYKQGLPLMRALRDRIETNTGEAWWLYHVKHDAYSLGGAAIRPRYFWVASRIPFGIEPPEPRKVPILLDAIGDLEWMPRTWSTQPYRVPAGWWARDKVNAGGVDGCWYESNLSTRRALDLLPGAGAWAPREIVSDLARRHYDRRGELPASWSHMTEKLVRTDFAMGYNQLTRWRYDRAARVITGGGLQLVLHPTQDRTLSHREVARIMGFPDDWKIEPLRTYSTLRLTWGKGITCQSGFWISTWVRHALESNPGSYVGNLIGDREYLIDVTHAYRKLSNER